MFAWASRAVPGLSRKTWDRPAATYSKANSEPRTNSQATAKAGGLKTAATKATATSRRDGGATHASSLREVTPRVRCWRSAARGRGGVRLLAELPRLPGQFL